MFKSRRSGLVRRLWRSRLVTESDGGRRGEAGRKSHCDRHSGKLHRHGPRSVTRAEPAPGPSGGAGGPTGSAEREEEEQTEEDRGAMCAPEHRGSPQGQDGDGGTVTCCLFGEWDLSPYCASGKDAGEPCQCASRQEDLASTAHAFLKRLKEGNLEALARTVESKGSSECVMVTNSELRLGARRVSPQYLLCRMYRWSDLPVSARLKRLCHCQSFGSVENTDVCCNPYHYSRLCGPGKEAPREGDGWAGGGCATSVHASIRAHVGLISGVLGTGSARGSFRAEVYPIIEENWLFLDPPPPNGSFHRPMAINALVSQTCRLPAARCILPNNQSK